MRKLARLFGFREERRIADAARSQRQRAMGAGMGGASKKFTRAMQLIPPERPSESGVFVTGARLIDVKAPRLLPTVDARVIEEVTLIVYGWENVQPGTLSWVFPSLRAALDAVRTMRNAVQWAVLNGVAPIGTESRDIDSARENGRVLVEAN